MAEHHSKRMIEEQLTIGRIFQEESRSTHGRVEKVDTRRETVMS